MKKIIFGFATLPLLAMLAVSCANERVETKGDVRGVIAFKAAAGKQTLNRAQEIDLTALQTASQVVPIVVTAYKTGAASTTPYATFNLKYEGYSNPLYTSGWGYQETPEFHPNFGLTYYSSVPTVALDAASNGVSASFEYTVPVVAEQKDLIAATAATTNGTQEDATADLVYKHLLSQINFAVTGLKDAKIIITNIEVKGVKNKGTYIFGATGWGATAAVDAGTSNTYAYTPAGDNFTDGTTAVTYFGNTGDIAAGANNANTNALMLMPQAFAGGDGNFTFDYQMLNNVAGANFGVEIAAATDVEVQFGDDALATKEWLPGKRYLYKLNFQSPNYILFTVDVEDWKDYDNAEGGVDIEVN